MVKDFIKLKNFSCIIILIFFCCSFASATNIKSDPTFKKTISKTSDYITKVMKKNDIVGLSIALVYNNEIVWSEGFGWADRDKKILADTETVYMLGSGSKTIATVGLLQYLDKGYISLDDPVSMHLPDVIMNNRFRNQSKGMSVRRLLNHHSGIPGDLYNNMGVERSWSKLGENLYIDWFLDYLDSDYPSYAPGEIAIYCNTGFILVGELIKKFSKEKSMSFSEIMYENLLKPLNMKSSSFELVSENLAKGYIDGKVVAPIQFNGISGATGGLFTNVEDMSKFVIMLLNKGVTTEGKQLLKPRTVAMMGESEVSPLDVNSYFIPGLGFDSVKDSTMSYAGRTWIKDGSTGNFNSIMGLLPDKKIGVIVLTNCDNSHLLKYSIMRECLKNALEEKFKLHSVGAKYPAWGSISNPQKIVGKYVYCSGYDEINMATGKDLVWKKHLLAGKADVKKLRFNGKRYSVEGSIEEIVFKNINGHLLMIQYGPSNSDIDKYMYNNFVTKIMGVKTTLPSINNAWKERVERVYLIDNLSWNDVNWEDGLTFSLIEKRGSLIVDLKGEQTLVTPYDENVAWVQGLNNRGDSSIRFIESINGEMASFSSYTGHDIKYITKITIGDTIENNDLPFLKTAWYKYTCDDSDGKIVFRVSESDRTYKLRLFNRDFKIVESGKMGISWDSKQGEWYLAVSPLPGDKSPFTLKVTSSKTNLKL